MSHYSVLVIGEDVEFQLAPFHEFECTGEDNEFVKDVDITEEALKEYASQTENLLVNEAGEQFKRYDNRFYRDPTPEEEKEIGPFAGTGSRKGISWTSQDWGDGRGYRAKVHYIPEGFKEIERPTKEVESFVEWAEGWYGKKPVPFGQEPDLTKEHKYGYILLNKSGEVEKVIKRTNQNAKWDWWVEGGRFSNQLLLKDGTYANSAEIQEIDFDGMKKERQIKEENLWDKVHKVITGLPAFRKWDDIRELYKDDIDEGRRVYHCQPIVMTLKGSDDEDLKWLLWDSRDEDIIMQSKEAYVASRVAETFITFAVVKGRKWYERGEMGWWACVSNEKDPETWVSMFNQLIADLPWGTRLTVVDCHI